MEFSIICTSSHCHRLEMVMCVAYRLVTSPHSNVWNQSNRNATSIKESKNTIPLVTSYEKEIPLLENDLFPTPITGWPTGNHTLGINKMEDKQLDNHQPRQEGAGCRERAAGRQADACCKRSSIQPVHTHSHSLPHVLLSFK